MATLVYVNECIYASMISRQEKCEFLPFMSPLSVITRPDTGRISHIVLARNEQVSPICIDFFHSSLDVTGKSRKHIADITVKLSVSGCICFPVDVF